MSYRKSNYKDIEKFRLTRNKSKRKYFSKTAKYKPRAWTELEDVKGETETFLSKFGFKKKELC